MHVLCIFALAVMTVFVSCSGNPDETSVPPLTVDADDVLPSGSSDTTVVSAPVEVSTGSQSITITGLEGGKLYTIYSDHSVSENSKRPAGVNSLGTGGTYAMVLPEGRTDVRLRASDIGLGSGGEFRIGDVSAPVMAFRDGSAGMDLGQGITSPLYIKPDGSEYFEAFFSLDTASIPDAENVVVNTSVTYGGVSSGRRMFRFVDENGSEIPDVNGNAAVDLSGYDAVYLWASLTVEFSERGMQYHLTLLNPVEIRLGSSVTLSGPSTYMIGPSSSPQLLLVDRKDSGLGVFNDSLNARYVETGKHFLHVFPVALTDDYIVVSIPPHAASIMFDYGGDARSARLVAADTGFSVDSMGTGEKRFTVDEGTFLYPVIFSDSLYGRTLSLETDAPDAVGRLGSAHVSGNGYSVDQIVPGQPFGSPEDRKLEYFFFLNNTGKSCTFTLTVE